MDNFKLIKVKLLVSLIALFLCFQVFKFINLRIQNINLPKGKIVFSSPVDGDYDIYIMNINGTKLKKLTNNSVSKEDSALDDSPSFSSDGKMIVFNSSRQGKDTELIFDKQGRKIGSGTSGKGASDIYIMNSEGNYQIPLTYGELNFDPYFSPSNNKIIFRSNRPKSTKLLDIDTHEVRILNYGGGKFEFSRDETKIFDNILGDISIMDVTGINRTRLTNLDLQESGSENKKNLIFNISSDGDMIVFVTEDIREVHKIGTISDYYSTFKFYTMKTNGSDLNEVYQLRPILGYVFGFKYSLDNKNIIFVKEDSSVRGIYLLSLEKKLLRNLTERKENWGSILNFTFTPDGGKIIFVADIYPKNYYFHAVVLRNIRAFFNHYFLKKSTPFYDNKYLCIMDIDGRNYRRITKLLNGTELGRDFIHWEK
ncbi:MAG: PD40 domain-containing protein [Candidatus Omnitrophica bacterium]|nr:PD40 domain-containing protein [Candidatus Omnitrophota bacterium]